MRTQQVQYVKVEFVLILFLSALVTGCLQCGGWYGDTLVTLSGVGEHSSSADPGVVTLGPRLG